LREIEADTGEAMSYETIRSAVVANLREGTGWLQDTAALAWEIQRRHAGLTVEPVDLTEVSWFALAQVLRVRPMIAARKTTTESRNMASVSGEASASCH
jgi:hypothetical protein